MKAGLALVCLLLWYLPGTARAHRLDEYLQATILSVGPETIKGSVRLVPGTAVSAPIIAGIDIDGDGVLSVDEQNRYAQRVLNDLRLSVDGRRLELNVTAAEFPTIADMRQGMGEIAISFSATLGAGFVHRVLTLENRHRRDLSVYLVNVLVPRDPAIVLGVQTRNQSQSYYRLEFSDGANGVHATATSELNGFDSAFRLGVRHIARGTDHLLFLLTCLLPAPLIAAAGRWRRLASVQASLTRIFRIVTSFTLGHSLTLALSVLGLVHFPSSAVEILVAISILASAGHAVRPLWPGWEVPIVAGFGLIHGLAFASSLADVGVTGGYRVVTLAGFNLGIEVMQLAVVAAALPSLLLLSRTGVYSALRLSVSAFAGVAALGWIAERAFRLPTRMDWLVDSIAHRAPWLATALFGIAVVTWLIGRCSLEAGLPHNQWQRAGDRSPGSSKLAAPLPDTATHRI